MDKLALFICKKSKAKSLKILLLAACLFAAIVFPVRLSAQDSEFGVNLAGLDFGPNNLPGTAATNFFVPNAAEFNYYSSFGLKLFRIPFIWERMQPTLGGALSTSYLTYLDQVVAAAAAANVSVYLDCHNYARYNPGSTTNPSTNSTANVITLGGPTQAQFNNLWTQLATHYASNSTVWGYDIMNEPHDLGSANWPAIAQSVVTAIRTVDMSHVIILEGDHWSQGHLWPTLPNSTGLAATIDPAKNLVFEAHQYFDTDESGQYASNSFAGNTPLGTANTVTSGVTLITPFVDWIGANKLRGLVGEYGIPNNASTVDQTNWNSLLDNFLKLLQDSCILGTYWAGGPGWGNGYVTSSEPLNNNYTNSSDERPQMPTLAKYTAFTGTCTPVSQPVTLSSFSLSASAATVTLYWTTASEINNNYFAVERSADGISFEEIGQVKGNGTSVIIHNYSFLDASPLGGTAYYRLAQYDYNGNLNYSKIISTTTENKVEVIVAPNPFANTTSLIVSGAPQLPVQLKVLDLTGKTMHSGTYNTNEGIGIGGSLSPGLYVLQIQINDQVYVQKIIKQ